MNKNLQLKIEEILLEGHGPSMVRVTKNTKRSQQKGSSAMRLAKSAKDPLYDRYHKFNEMRKDIKKKIMQKYGARAMKFARKTIG